MTPPTRQEPDDKWERCLVNTGSYVGWEWRYKPWYTRVWRWLKGA